MITVKATREGLSGGKTATGYHVEGHAPFVALPSTAALRLWVRVTNPATGRSVKALVLDIGPWNETDHGYVFQDATIPGFREDDDTTLVSVRMVRPQAESGVDMSGRKTNKAGIDLGERVWRELGMKDNTNVSWEFV